MGWFLPYPILCFHLFLFHFSYYGSSFESSCTSLESSALLRFKNSFSLNNESYNNCNEHSYSYPKTRSWGNGSNCCLWDGVTCDSISGHVIGLDFSCSWLRGELHPNSSLFQLSHLQKLNLGFNYFSGSSLSSQFGDLVSLTHLNLTSSGFVGEIPSRISQLSKLVSLDLSRNYGLTLEVFTWEKLVPNITDLQELVLDGVIMSSIRSSSLSLLMNLSSSLLSLSLSGTELQGSLENNILCLKSLQKLDLSRNENLKGQLPKSNWSSSLRYLDFSGTAFSGEVPDSIGHSKSLSFLSLEHCQFEGPIPITFGNLTQLTYLSLNSNKFSGEILSLLSNLKLITSLDISSNNFRGQIPSSFSNLQHLTYLDLSRNNFSGEILHAFGKLSKLESLSLSYNNIEGPLPSSFSNLTQLVYLDFYFNKLVGPIPDKLCKLSNLAYLDLSSNLLNATIPVSCFSSSSLHTVDLSDNCLTGPIGPFPTHSSLEFLYLDNNKMQGNIHESIFGLVNLTELYLSSNNLSGPVNFHHFSKLRNLEQLFLSENKFLSLSFDNDVDYTIPNLQELGLSSCNINSLPRFQGNLQNLYTLNLSNNKIQGNIPEWFTSVGNGSLSDLDLSHNYLTSAEYLSMRNLEFLDLSSNMLQGNILKWFNNLGNDSLTSLYLDLSHNYLTSTSAEYLSMINLNFLDLSFNMLQGNLPIPHVGMEFFSVSNNRLSGEIPSLFCNASTFQIVNLAHNNLTGPIPECLVASPNLLVLDLQMNNFVGSIPSNFSKSNSFQTLHFNGNQLEGPLPLCLAHCNQLEILDVGDNIIEDTFPNWLEGLQDLQVLVLRHNKFRGTISHSNMKQYPFPKLRILDVSNNHLCGPLPASYIKEFKGMMEIDNSAAGLHYVQNNYSSTVYKDSVMVTMKGIDIKLERILTIFSSIDLSSNMFDGEIPKVIGELHSLKGLNLSHNRISGVIPKSLGNLKSLEWLDLSSNNLGGEIPSTLTNLNFLAILNLSENHLEGIIPRGQQFDTFLNNSFAGNPGLCGIQVSKTCNKGEEAGDGESSSSSPESILEWGFSWKTVALGYGCGMVFGMVMGYIVFSTGKPQWLVQIFVGPPRRRARRLRRSRNTAHAS